MRKIFFLLVFFTFLPVVIFAQDDKPCTSEAISILKEFYPDGYKVYLAIGHDEFNSYLRCDDRLFVLDTAVHESVHGLRKSSINGDSFYMPGGVYMVAAYFNTYPRNKIGTYLDEDEKGMYYHRYLTGDSGTQGLDMLLDELNAYTFSLLTGINLWHLVEINERSSLRDGLITFMYYLELYLRYGREYNQNDYIKIKNNSDYLLIIKAMWENAEQAMLLSVPYRNIGVDEKPFIRKVYTEENLKELILLFEETDYKINFIPDLKITLYPDININTKSDKYTVELITACRNGDLEKLKQLVAAGANVNAMDRNYNFPLLAATDSGKIELVKYLIKNGASVNLCIPDYISEQYGYAGSEGDNALLRACFLNNLSIIKILVENGANINIKDYYGNTPLQYVICQRYPNIDLINYFINNRADVNVKDCYGSTPLMYSAMNGDIKSVNIFISHGADLNYQNIDGETALMLAVNQYKIVIKSELGNMFNIIKRLIDEGTNLELKNKQGKTVFDIIKSDNYFKDIKDYLISIKKWK